MLSNVLGIILAGGKGDRLFPLTEETAKPVVTYAANTNMISLVIGSLFGCSIQKVDIYTQYARESVARFVEDYWLPVLDRSNDQSLWVVPPTKTSGYRGTADAVHHNLESIKQLNPSHVIVTAADHACWIDYRTFLNFHHSRGADLSIAVLPVLKQEAVKRLGVLEVDSRHKVIDFREKPENPASMHGHPDKVLASMGIYIFKTDFLIEILERIEREYIGRHDFGHDVIPMALELGAKIYAYYHEGYWQDLGSIKTYYNAQIQDLLGSNPRFNPYVNPFMPELGIKRAMLPPANIHDAAITNGALISNGCVIKRCLMEKVILSPEVVIEAGVSLTGVIAHRRVRVGHGSHLEKVIAGRDVIFPPNTIITPEKVDYVGRYYQGAAGITVVV